MSTCGVLLVKWRSISTVLLKDMYVHTAAVDIAYAPVVATCTVSINFLNGTYLQFEIFCIIISVFCSLGRLVQANA